MCFVARAGAVDRKQEVLGLPIPGLVDRRGLLADFTIMVGGEEFRSFHPKASSPGLFVGSPVLLAPSLMY